MPRGYASPHFRYMEFACHNGTLIPSHSRPDVRELCHDFLEPLRAKFGPVTIVSGYRTANYNRTVGGAPDSMHIYRKDRPGAAADVRCQRGEAPDWHALLDELGIGGLGLYTAHVHADTRSGHARW